MLICAHKALLLDLAREHSRNMRQSVALARAQLGEGALTVRILMGRLVQAEQAEAALEHEPARQLVA